VDHAGPEHDRAGAALRLLASSRSHLLRVAARVSICADDAEDALARATEILLTRGPDIEHGRLIAWMTVVTRREALAVRRARERLLGTAAFRGPNGEPFDPLARAVSPVPDPAEVAERAERVAEGFAALAELKPAERTAIWFQALGYSYAEIGQLRRWTYTKVNRCLAEGRARLRSAA
jgi:DNA-directed RNA polymerase specialized sigma24 family protein